MSRQGVINMLEGEIKRVDKYIHEFIVAGNPSLANAHKAIYDTLQEKLSKELQLQHEDKMRELLTGYSTNVIDQGIAGIQPPYVPPFPHVPKGMKYFANLMSGTDGAVTMNPIKPRTNIGRIITKTHLVYDLVKKKKYIAQVSDRLTTFEEVDTDRPATHTSYDGCEKLLEIKGVEMEQLLYYISKGVYSEIELRKMVLKEIKGKKKVFVDRKRLVSKTHTNIFEIGSYDSVIANEPPSQDRVAIFKQVCRRFDRCEKLVRLASVKDYSNLNEARVAYKMLMKEYTIIIVTLMSEGKE